MNTNRAAALPAIIARIESELPGVFQSVKSAFDFVSEHDLREAIESGSVCIVQMTSRRADGQQYSDQYTELQVYSVDIVVQWDSTPNNETTTAGALEAQIITALAGQSLGSSFFGVLKLTDEQPMPLYPVFNGNSVGYAVFPIEFEQRIILSTPECTG